MLRAAAIVLACACTVYSATTLRPARNSLQNNGYSIPTYQPFNWWSNMTDISDPENIELSLNPKANKTEISDDGLSLTSLVPLTGSKETSEEESLKILTIPNESQSQYTPELYPSASVSQPEFRGLYPGIPQYLDPPSLMYSQNYLGYTAPQNTDGYESMYVANNPLPLFPSKHQKSEYQKPKYPKQYRSGLWKAPPFIQALNDFEEVTKIVLSRIQNYTSSGENEYQLRYIIIAGVLDGMIQIMSQTQSQYYDQEYDTKVPRLFKYSEIASHSVKTQVECSFHQAETGITKLKNIIRKRWIKYICRMSQVVCDILVLTVVDAANNDELKHEARLLIALGKSARLFLDKYADTLDREASVTHRLFMFIISAKEYFKPLIQAASEARRLLPSPYCEELQLNHRLNSTPLNA